MKALHLNAYLDGGAGKAALRICHCLRSIGCNAFMAVPFSESREVYIISEENLIYLVKLRLLNKISRVLMKISTFRTKNKVLHSPNLFSYYSASYLDSLLPNIIHLHWIAANLLSVEEVSKLRHPIVWTLHDMWAFCGAEHYTEDFRWKEGYYADNRPPYEKGFDLNRWTWERKCKHWQRPIYIVAPSQWLGECVRQSALMRKWPVSVIPNPIDTEYWQPHDKNQVRQQLGLAVEMPLILFGAMGGGKDPRKGFDLLKKALGYLKNENQQLQLVIFGEAQSHQAEDFGFPVHYTGHIKDESYLCKLYSAADIMIVPSRQDNLPNVAVEAISCGTPVVAFKVGGLPDIVVHQQTGYLASPFEPMDLAYGIQWVLEDPQRHSQLRAQARAHAVKQFAYPVVAKQYLALYEEVLERHRQEQLPVQ